MRSARLAAVSLLVLAAAACSSNAGSAAHDDPVVSFSSASHPTSSGTVTNAQPRPRSSSPARPSSVPASSTSPAVPVGLIVVLNPGHNGDDYAHPDEVNRLVPSGYGNVKA